MIFFDGPADVDYSSYRRADVPVLIDGNNLLFAARAVEDPDRLIGRSMLCVALGAWARRRGERVHVIFDGPPPTNGLAQQIAADDIRVSYSGSGVPADSAIAQELEQDSAARRNWVVSSDREVARAAKRRRARPVRAEVFWRMLKRDLAHRETRPEEPAEKEAGLSEGAAEEWLRELGLE